MKTDAEIRLLAAKKADALWAYLGGKGSQAEAEARTYAYGWAGYGPPGLSEYWSEYRREDYRRWLRGESPLEYPEAKAAILEYLEDRREAELDQKWLRAGHKESLMLTVREARREAREG